MHKKEFRILFLVLCSLSLTLNAQKLINSPYSRFNLGSLESEGSFRSIGMGGTSTGMRQSNTIYFLNPASYSSLDTNSFVFDFGLDYAFNNLSDNTTKFSSDDINFHHMIIGFPIAKGFGFAAGVVPMSNGYYKIAETVTSTSPGYDANIGAYTTANAGTGGFNTYFLGTGLKLTKNFSAGINMTILSGQVIRTNELVFTDYYNVYNDNNTESIQLRGLNFDYGLQYSAKLKKNYFFNAGISVSASHNYHTNYNQLSYRYTAYGTRDTLTYITNDATKTLIPATLRLGISFGKVNKFTAGIDYTQTNWSKSKIPGAAGYVADSKSWKFGLEFIPDKYSNYSFLKRVEYRIGGHIGNDYLIVNTAQVKEFGASIGIGIPLPRSQSMTNLFFDYSKRYGTSGTNLHTEEYYSFGISLNLHDLWFMKRKFD